MNHVQQEGHTAVGIFAAENKSSRVQKHLKNFRGLGESTVSSFKQIYQSLLAREKSSVGVIPTKRMGRLLAHGDIDEAVQKYIKALRAVISVPMVIAAAQGITEAKDKILLAEMEGASTYSVTGGGGGRDFSIYMLRPDCKPGRFKASSRL